MHERLDESFTTLFDRFDALQATYIAVRKTPQPTKSLEALSSAHVSLLQALEEFQLAMRALHQPVLGDIAAEALGDGHR